MLTFCSDKTAVNLGLHRHQSRTKQSVDSWPYTSLADPPPADPENEAWSSSIYRGIIPAKNINRRDFAINGAVVGISYPFISRYGLTSSQLTTNDGYSFEVIANWISSYFLGDKMVLPSSPEEALASAEYDSAWLRKRHPNTLLSINESCSSFSAFWTYETSFILSIGLNFLKFPFTRWPQYCDKLLEDMYLPSMRSGGNWLTWPFKVIDVEELATLGKEREANRVRA